VSAKYKKGGGGKELTWRIPEVMGKDAMQGKKGKQLKRPLVAEIVTRRGERPYARSRSRII
jgi:hypothetical protein